MNTGDERCPVAERSWHSMEDEDITRTGSRACSQVRLPRPAGEQHWEVKGFAPPVAYMRVVNTESHMTIGDKYFVDVGSHLYCMSRRRRAVSLAKTWH